MSLEAANPRKRLSSGLSVTSKVFVRSRNGNATKIVREHYLRDDIPCYSKLCSQCLQVAKPGPDGDIPQFVLSEDPLNLPGVGPHYTVIDTNIVLNAIDLLENDQVFYDVIVPQTVLEEVRNKSFPIYLRLRNLCKSDSKRFVVFHNEFSEYTHVDRQRGEIINDYNDRLIRKVAEFYNKHIPEIRTILITNDKANRALNDDISLNLIDYISKLPNSNALLDLIPPQQDFHTVNEIKYPEYYSTSRIMGGLENGTLHQGVMSVSSYNFLQGTIQIPSLSKPLLILGRDNLNRAFNGDVCVVEILPKSQWRASLTEITNTEDDEEVNEENDFVMSDLERRQLSLELKKSQSDSKIQPTGRVVGVIKRSWRQYVGTLASSTLNSSGNSLKSCFVNLMDRTLPKVRIRTRRSLELAGQRIVIAIDSWPSTSKYPEGHFVRALGEVEDVQAETELLLLEHDVEYKPFTANVLKCLPLEGADWKPSQEEIKRRWDLREKLICSIDPPGCVDIDDALHLLQLPNGNYEVGVHIADVTNFVKAGTAIDKEAASRGTSVYLVDKRIDMLPELLGTDLCSLKPYVERYAFSVLWELDQDANIVNVKFNKSIILSKELFSYEQAQKRISDDKQQDDLTKGMRILLQLSKKLKLQRIAAGALNLASPEVKVHMDSETADPNEVEIKELFETNSLVEEFMLLANISVLRKIFELYPLTAMLRRHAAPPLTNFEVLNDMLRVRKGLNISLENSKLLLDSLDRCIDPADPYFNTLIRIVSTRCMMAAEYFPSGSYSYPEFRHYGLAVDIYTHFTSPIRRYCDVVAHRQLAGAIGYEDLDVSHRDKAKMEVIVKNINKRHRNAQFAGRASIEYYVGQVMKNNKENRQQGYVIKVFSNGIVVLVPKFGIESLIKLEDEHNLEFDEENYTLTLNSKDSKVSRSLSVFDKCEVEIRSVLDEFSGKRKAYLSLV